MHFFALTSALLGSLSLVAADFHFGMLLVVSAIIGQC